MSRKRFLAAVLLAAALPLAACSASPGSSAGAGAELEVHFFDAGKADASLLTTADSAVLIDAGEKGFGKEILSYLEEKGVERLDYLIVTHFDQDHVGGAAKVLNNIEVGTVLQSNRPKDSEEYEKYVKALKNAGIEPTTVRETLSFTLDGVRYTVDPPRQEDYDADSSNNSSLIVTAENDENRFLFLGDAQTERLAELLSGGVDACDVLKVAHHGGDEPLLGELLEAASPGWAVITSSDDEPESAETVALLERSGAQVLLTREGAVTAQSDGTALRIIRA